MPLMTLNRDFIIKSTNGHVVRFTQNEPLYVPPGLYQEALKYGAELVDKGDAIKQANPPAKASPQGQDRIDQIKEAILNMLARNERGDFTGSGLPAVPAIDKLVGFAVDASERNELWKVVQEETSDAVGSNETLVAPASSIEGEPVSS